MVNFIIYIFLPCITKDRKVVLGEAFHKLTSRYFSTLQKFCLFEKAETGPVPRQLVMGSLEILLLLLWAGRRE
jgi:hypothetical protein